MASVDKVPGGKWRARWRTPEGACRSRTFSRKVDAERWLTNVEGAKLGGLYIDPAMAETTLAEYIGRGRRRNRGGPRRGRR